LPIQSYNRRQLIHSHIRCTHKYCSNFKLNFQIQYKISLLTCNRLFAYENMTALACLKSPVLRKAWEKAILIRWTGLAVTMPLIPRRRFSMYLWPVVGLKLAMPSMSPPHPTCRTWPASLTHEWISGRMSRLGLRGLKLVGIIDSQKSSCLENFCFWV
jgi:hypothetical protein